MPDGWLIAHWIWNYGGDLAMAACCTAAFRRGGPVERRGAAILLAGWILTLLVVYLRIERAQHGIHYVLFAIDSVVLVAFTWLSLWSRRLWTVVLAAFQLNDVLTHLAALSPKMDTFTYITALGIWGGWGLVAVLGWAVWDHDRRRTA
ncbi:MAG: hypothetical protein WDN06_08335 [Asticcacaulis sp.]